MSAPEQREPQDRVPAEFVHDELRLRPAIEDDLTAIVAPAVLDLGGDEWRWGHDCTRDAVGRLGEELRRRRLEHVPRRVAGDVGEPLPGVPG